MGLHAFLHYISRHQIACSKVMEGLSFLTPPHTHFSRGSNKGNHTQSKSVAWFQFHKAIKYGLIKLPFSQIGSKTQSHETTLAQLSQHTTEPNGCPRFLFRWERYPYLGLKMETVSFSETLMSTYVSTRRHNPEEHSHLRHSENLKFSCVLISKKLFG
jgi:hypothetical protein